MRHDRPTNDDFTDLSLGERELFGPRWDGLVVDGHDSDLDPGCGAAHTHASASVRELSRFLQDRPAAETRDRKRLCCAVGGQDLDAVREAPLESLECGVRRGGTCGYGSPK